MPLILPNNIANNQDADGDLLQQNFATIEDWANQEAISRDGSTGMTGALLLPGPPTQPNQAATKAYVDATGLIGEMKMFGGDAEPANWMFCRGQAVSRATYAALFGVIGVKFGAGDGSTSFNLPDMRGQYAVGYNAGGAYLSLGVGERFGSKDAIVPSHAHSASSGTVSADHTHSFNVQSGGESEQHYHLGLAGQSTILHAYSTGIGYASGANQMGAGGTHWNAQGHTHNVAGQTGGISTNHSHAITVNAAGGDAANGNLPPSVSVNYLIKVS